MRHRPVLVSLGGQPLAVERGQGVVAEEAAFQERNPGWPLAKFAGCGRDGATERGAHLAKIGVVGGCLGVGDLAVDFPGCVAFEAAHDFAFALAFRGAFGHVVLRSPARCHADEDDLVQGVVGVAVTASAEPVTGRFS